MNHQIVPIGAAVLLLFALMVVFSVPAQAQDAASVYKSKCVVCHAADGSGDTPAGKAMGVLDLRRDEVQKLTDAQIFDDIANGVGKKMPAYKGKITDDQIKGLVTYIRGLAKK